MKIVKKFPEELKRVKLENELLGVCLDESNKLNVTLEKNFASEVEKNKSLEQELAISLKLNMTNCLVTSLLLWLS